MVLGSRYNKEIDVFLEKSCLSIIVGWTEPNANQIIPSLSATEV